MLMHPPRPSTHAISRLLRGSFGMALRLLAYIPGDIDHAKGRRCRLLLKHAPILPDDLSGEMELSCACFWAARVTSSKSNVPDFRVTGKSCGVPFDGRAPARPRTYVARKRLPRRAALLVLLVTSTQRHHQDEQHR